MHLFSSTRRYQSAAISFGHAVERAAAKHATTVRGEEILAQLKVAVPDWRER